MSEDSGYTGGYGSPSAQSSVSGSPEDGSSQGRRAFSGSIAMDPNATPDESREEDFSTADIERARKAIAASQATADKLLQGSRQLEQTIFGVLDDDEDVMSVDEDKASLNLGAGMTDRSDKPDSENAENQSAVQFHMIAMTISISTRVNP